ncbi:DUF4231 domain-containing protein, partial [Nocardia cyriacigeorgica]|uniref:DUF4231 domain-containing protein n=1 Tax=Nocardia cyriacigeorgica TaxID=135487 RepID=UPI003D76F2FE
MAERRQRPGRGTMSAADDPVWARLTDQISWYSTRSSQAQRAYRRVKFGQIVVGSTVPVLAALSAPARGGPPRRPAGGGARRPRAQLEGVEPRRGCYHRDPPPQ